MTLLLQQEIQQKIFTALKLMKYILPFKKMSFMHTLKMQMHGLKKIPAKLKIYKLINAVMLLNFVQMNFK